MFEIKYDIKDDGPVAHEYNWKVLGRLIAQCVDASVSQEAVLAKGFEVIDGSKESDSEVRTFFTRAYDKYDTIISSWFAFKNVAGLGYRASIVEAPSSNSDGLPAHLARYPLK